MDKIILNIPDDVLPALCNAVVMQAVEDYRTAKRNFLSAKTSLQRKKATAMLDDCKEFFLSDRFYLFTNISGKVLYEYLLNEQ